MILSIPIKLLISLLIGAAIGLEREAYERRVDTTPSTGVGSLGIRTYALITTLGTVAAVLMHDYFSLFLLVSVAFIALLVAYYILGSWFTKDNGLTTDIAILWSYLIGAIIGLDVFPMALTVAIVVCLILILSAKQRIRTFVAGIKNYEIEGFIGFAIIALVILPFLPDHSFALKEIPFLATLFTAYKLNFPQLMSLELINPFSIWKVVALITGVEIAGYVLEKSIGQRSGWLLTSIVGGFISSTSTTQSLAQQSKNSKNANQLVSAALFSNLASFLQMFILLASINGVFLVSNTLFILTISLTTLVTGLYFYFKKNKREENLSSTRNALDKDRIFSLRPALQFALIFMAIKLITKISLLLFGNNGFLVSNIFGALTGLDAVTINIAELAGKTITFQTGIIAVVLANTVNLLSKITYTFIQGSREFAYKFSASIGIVILASFLSLWIVLM
ncbi:MgtC/SapB family protein [Candidatus Woesebacteria bacterium]|nr:MgtC/SapB family protein [Candidatus Woesebacteria bacterium]